MIAMSRYVSMGARRARLSFERHRTSTIASPTAPPVYGCFERGLGRRRVKANPTEPREEPNARGERAFGARAGWGARAPKKNSPNRGEEPNARSRPLGLG